MNDFDRDDAFAKRMRDCRLAPQFYGRYTVEGRYVFLDKGRLARALQRKAVDTIVQGRDGAAVAIEEKIVRWPKSGRPYTAFSLETHSCTVPGRESPGWMRYCVADYLLYCFQQPDDGLICHLIDFPKLQAWFNQHEDAFPVFGPLPTLNRSMGRVVDIALVADAVGDRVFICHGDQQPELFQLGGRPEGGRAQPTP
jgi:hypothetical protein